MPTAVHPTPAMHDTEFRRSIGPTSGLGSIDQDDPFQYSMKALRLEAVASATAEGPVGADGPAARGSDARDAAQHGCPRVPFGTGTVFETSVHAEPFHCSIKRPDPWPVESVTAPEAQQSTAERHSMP